MSGRWKADPLSWLKNTVKGVIPWLQNGKGLISIIKVVNDFIKWCSIIKMAAVTWGPNDLEVSGVNSKAVKKPDLNSKMSSQFFFSPLYLASHCPTHLKRIYLAKIYIFNCVGLVWTSLPVTQESDRGVLHSV